MRTNVFMVVLIVVLFGLAAAFTVRYGMSAKEGEVAMDPRFVPVVEAITTGDTARLSSLLTSDPRLVQAYVGDESLLHVAARMNQPECIDLLVERGADLAARGQWGGTPLHWACWFGNAKAAEKLADKGCDIEDKNDVFGSTPLLWAAHGSGTVPHPKGDYVGTVRILIAKGADASTSNADGVPAVMMASEAVAEELRKHGAKVPVARPASGGGLMM